jgi:hypothetical protein
MRLWVSELNAIPLWTLRSTELFCERGGREIRGRVIQSDLSPHRREDVQELLRRGQVAVDVLPVRLPRPLHQGDQGDLLPEGEVRPREPARVERDALAMADLEDGPDHPYVPRLLLPHPADDTILSSLEHGIGMGSAKNQRPFGPAIRSDRVYDQRVSADPYATSCFVALRPQSLTGLSRGPPLAAHENLPLIVRCSCTPSHNGQD